MYERGVDGDKAGTRPKEHTKPARTSQRLLILLEQLISKARTARNVANTT